MRNILGFLALTVLALSCDSGRAQSAATVDCNQPPLTIFVLTKQDDGWDVAFAKTAKVTKTGPFRISNGKEIKDSGLTAVVYEVSKQVIAVPKIEVNPCNKTGTIGYWYLIPTLVLGLEKNGHLFAYHVSAELSGGATLDSGVLGANMHVMFYDMEGRGVFSLVKISSGVGLPFVPDWVEKAAEKGNDAATSPPR